jgi:hypothetical protein
LKKGTKENLLLKDGSGKIIIFIKYALCRLNMKIGK